MISAAKRNPVVTACVPLPSSVTIRTIVLDGIGMSHCIAETQLGSNVTLLLIHGDITASNADAIVNAANAQLLHGGGVAGAILRKGGPVIQKESLAWVKTNGPAGPERPAVTTAGDLPARVVIHAVGPIWGEGDEDAKLTAAVDSAMKAAGERNLASIALPAIATGIYHFPVKRAANIILGTIEKHTHEHPQTSLREVQLVIIDQPTLDVFADVFAHRWPTQREMP